ncbi:MAG: 50S ribosomal protein L17 [Rickettsiales bacterium]|nr:50S ribosomal protein L17 [Rickettsiales bacterium]
MKHLAKSHKKLNRTSSHRKAMLSNMANSLFEHGRIETTLIKAKALRPYAEKLITLAKNADLNSRRRLISKLRNELSVKNLIDNVSPKHASRNGGYTRIIKTGNRYGDNAPKAIIEIVE